jgi:hypothetical protein
MNNVQKHSNWENCFDFLLGFCKSFFHVTGKLHSPYMLDGKEC